MKTRTSSTSRPATSLAAGATVVRIAAVDRQGRVHVNVPECGPVPARLGHAVAHRLGRGAEMAGVPVLVVFEDGRSDRPVVVDTVEETLPATPDGGGGREPGKPGEVAERLTLAARESIELRCGEASMVLTRAGKVIVRGTYLSSTSCGVHRIRGGSIQLN